MAANPARASYRSLSSRLLWLTLAIVLLTEGLIFFPSLGHERRVWLQRHVREANIAALAVAGAPHGLLDPATRDDLLRLSGDELIRLHRASGVELVLAPPEEITPVARYDLRHETQLASVGYALVDLFRSQDRPITIIGNSPLRPKTVVELIMHERELLDVLHDYAWSIAGLSLIIAAVTGALVYFAMLALLVRPIRRITGSIVAFRADPERGVPIDAEAVSLLGDDEMAEAARELADMQRELRAALWRNARLAALGTAVATVSHDLRGILASAMLAADDLTQNLDGRVRRSGEMVVRAIERATEMVRRTLDFAREGPPPVTRTCFPLRLLIGEVREAMLPAAAGFSIAPCLDDDLLITGDRDLLFRVFVNLLRNAAEAGAGRVTVKAKMAASAVEILIEDNGPGLPEPVRQNLFRPFVGSYRRGGTGLGLAIARDLMRAHGGDLELAETGPNGTIFRLTLPSQPEESTPPVVARQSATP